VASPPSSTIILGPFPSGQINALKVHSQYYLKLSPFHAKTFAVFALAIADAAWSYVEKILQLHHLISAPS